MPIEHKTILSSLDDNKYAEYIEFIRQIKYGLAAITRGEAKNSMIQIKKHDYILHNSHSVTSTSKSIEINDFRRKMIRSNMPHYL